MLVCLLPLDFCIFVALLINQILLKLYTPFFLRAVGLFGSDAYVISLAEIHVAH